MAVNVSVVVTADLSSSVVGLKAAYTNNEAFAVRSVSGPIYGYLATGGSSEFFNEVADIDVGNRLEVIIPAGGTVSLKCSLGTPAGQFYPANPSSGSYTLTGRVTATFVKDSDGSNATNVQGDGTVSVSHV